MSYVQLDQALQGDQGHRGIHLDPENQFSFNVTYFIGAVGWG